MLDTPPWTGSLEKNLSFSELNLLLTQGWPFGHSASELLKYDRVDVEAKSKQGMQENRRPKLCHTIRIKTSHSVMPIVKEVSKNKTNEP